MVRAEDREPVGHRLSSVRSSFLDRAFSLRSSGDASGDYSKFVDEVEPPAIEVTPQSPSSPSSTRQSSRRGSGQDERRYRLDASATDAAADRG